MHIQPLLLSSTSLIGSTLRSGSTSASPSGASSNDVKPSTQPADELTLSAEAQAASAAEDASATSATTELTPEEQEQVQKLESRDQEVRQHEQAHLAAAGGFAQGGPTFTYQQGPDGQRYAIGGEVQIDTSPIDGDPHATLQKARVIQAAALSPSEPSSQDQAVAAAAVQLVQSAQQELQQRNADPTAEEGLAGASLLDAVDVNAPSAPSSTAAQSSIIGYFAQEAEAAYSQAAAKPASSLFLLA
ncbi:putative metalloprotease CJM1_0395 family protein [Blastopirellula marina]|uniref:SrpA-related protein n=1 Tax=Blastopirellula marina DSM 3645 TaxID=314230 RepID=A3ZW83_9BACT|nr:putative metalloprotease CJM1_0395 family protein [Blastopirellula marina]EAQ79111.1 hypothetical protein DSM3645_25849 [Blastopirellula marina DSM 3645]